VHNARVAEATVREIWRYPVKSMAGERLPACAVGPNGLAGDHGWAVIGVESGEIHNAKRFPRLMQCTSVYREARTHPAG
jgi:uncharacterized protein YcbX